MFPLKCHIKVFSGWPGKWKSSCSVELTWNMGCFLWVNQNKKKCCVSYWLLPQQQSCGCEWRLWGCVAILWSFASCPCFGAGSFWGHAKLGLVSVCVGVCVLSITLEYAELLQCPPVNLQVVWLMLRFPSGIGILLCFLVFGDRPLMSVVDISAVRQCAQIGGGESVSWPKRRLRSSRPFLSQLTSVQFNHADKTH